MSAVLSRLPPMRASQAMARASVGHVDEPAELGWPGDVQVLPQQCPIDSGSCAAAAQAAGPATGLPLALVYGTVDASFPSLSVEKEFFQAVDMSALPDGTDWQASDSTDLWRINQALRDQAFVYSELSKPENYYIARQMCWSVRLANGAGSYGLAMDEDALLPLINALKADPVSHQRPAQLIYGRLLPAASMACAALTGPMIQLVKMLPSDVQSIAKRVGAGSAMTFDNATLSALIEQVLPLAGNAGREPSERALNYSVVDNVAFYEACYPLVSGVGGVDYELMVVSAAANGQSQRAGEQVLTLVLQQTANLRVRRLRCVLDASGLFPFLIDPYRPQLAAG